MKHHGEEHVLVKKTMMTTFKLSWTSQEVREEARVWEEATKLRAARRYNTRVRGRAF